MLIEPPYLLYLGDAEDILSIKIAKGIVDWRAESCVGEYCLPSCEVTTGLAKLSIAEAKQKGALTLVLGLANSGGKIAESWLPDIYKALEAGLDIASGLHQKLSDFPKLVELANKYNCRLIDVRHSPYPKLTGTGEKRTGHRLLTVATDCSIGKMYTALCLERAMREQAMDVEFIATGQSGIFITGKGIAVDCVISDFISGVVEQLSPNSSDTHWDIIEGQGSLFHPAFAGVSLGLLHGAQPDALVLCHQEGRESMRGVNYSLPTVERAMALNLQMAKLTNLNAKFVGISLNTSDLSEKKGLQLCQAYQDKFGLPCCDPMKMSLTPIIDNLQSTNRLIS